MKYLDGEHVWITKPIYDEAERKYQEVLAKSSLTPLAGEVARARQRLIESRDTFKEDTRDSNSVDHSAIKFLEKKVLQFDKSLTEILRKLDEIEARVTSIEKNFVSGTRKSSVSQIKFQSSEKADKQNDDDDLDLFGSDSEEENEAANKIKEERLAAYHAKKSKKPALIAKSNVILDVKPWDDETDMKEMEAVVRKIETDGLLWGAAKLVPLAYGIHKLQISCVVEDEKVSIDWLQEQIESLSDYVQSVDIAAFNKI